jgi:hypothetical protein
MLCSKNLIFNAKEVPPTWVFSNYCAISIDQFDGSAFKIKSIFTDEKTPSMGFFVKNGKYRFNDFSSGNKGDCLDLVKLIYNLDFPDTCNKVISDYNHWILNHSTEPCIPQYTQQPKYSVTDCQTRKWNITDKDYWTDYNIGSAILDEFLVKPIEMYTMRRKEQEFTISGNHIYGYFKKNGELYKIYQPRHSHCKFIKLADHIQGEEQSQGKPYMIYLSSLKDIMALHSLHLNLDSKAPDSENTPISEEVVKKDIETYKKVLVLFDNDKAGIKASEAYKKKYNIETAFLNYGEKDLSDHIKKYGPQKTMQWLVPILDKKINT